MRTRRWWTWGTATVAIVTFMSATPAASSTTTVPPKQYVNSVCHALALFKSATSSRVSSASQTYRDSPSQESAISLRQAILDELDGLDGLVASLVHRTVAAGVPNIAGGKQFADAVVDHEHRVAAIKLAVRAQAQAIDVSTSSLFASTTQGVATALDDAFAATKSSARTLPAVRRAPEEMHPLVTYLRTPKASACSSS